MTTFEYEHDMQLLYGKHVVIKLSGAEFLRKDFSFLVDAIHKLLKHKIQVSMIFGGGKEIDFFYSQKHATLRPKKDGVGITTKEVLHDGVLPAYDALKKILMTAFADIPFEMEFLDSSHIHVSPHPNPEFGFVGVPQNVVFDTQKSLHVLGFVGEDEQAQCYNINADEIVTCLANTKKVDEIFFVTRSGGILDNDGKILSLLTKEDVQNLLDDKFPNATVLDGMKKKMRRNFVSFVKSSQNCYGERRNPARRIVHQKRCRNPVRGVKIK